MLLLTDSPESVADFVPPTTAWAACVPGELPSADRPLALALGTGQRTWTAALEPPAGTEFWSRVVLIADAAGSQFDALRELYRLQEPVAGPVACLALTGHGFHGHRDRPWVAASGNLHLSVGIVRNVPAVIALPALTMLPAVATVEAVRAATAGAVQPTIKWVNDVMVAGQKIAGVLTATQTRQQRVESVVLGIGLNVARSPEVTPTPFVPAVGCLAELAESGPPALDGLFWLLLRKLAERYVALVDTGPSGLLAAYRSQSDVVGEQVRIYDETAIGDERALNERWPEPLARGTVEAIEPDLSLRLAGRAEPVTKGRLAFEAVCQRWGR